MAGKKKLKNIYDKYAIDQSTVREGNDVPAYMLHGERKNANFFFGTKLREKTTPGQLGTDVTRSRYCVGKPQNHDGHILVVGGAGSGKSSCVAIPTLETWGGTIFAIDIKGELSAHWNKMQTLDRPAKILNLANDGGVFASYDPFYFLRQDGDGNLVQNAREIAHAILPLPPDVREPFWIQSAQHVLTAVLLHGFGIGATFNATMTRILTVPIWDLIKEISAGDNLAAQMHINQFKDIKNPAENKMITGISAELCNKVMVFVTNMQIKDSFTPTENSIYWEDLETHSIFLRIAEDKLGQWDGAITLMLTQLIRSLERRRDKQYSNDKQPIVLSAGGQEIPPTLLLLDEFPRLGKMDVIQNAVSTLRSKGVTICLIMQSLTQLDKIYGKESRQIIIDNCPYKAILQVTDPENQKIFSDMIGTIRVGNVGISGDKKSLKDDKEDHKITVSEIREPIIHPHELANLKDILLMTPDGFCRVAKAPYYDEGKIGFVMPPQPSQPKVKYQHRQSTTPTKNTPR